MTKNGAPTHSSSSSTAIGVGDRDARYPASAGWTSRLAREVVDGEDAAARGREPGDQVLASRGRRPPPSTRRRRGASRSSSPTSACVAAPTRTPLGFAVATRAASASDRWWTASRSRWPGGDGHAVTPGPGVLAPVGGELGAERRDVGRGHQAVRRRRAPAATRPGRRSPSARPAGRSLLTLFVPVRGGARRCARSAAPTWCRGRAARRGRRRTPPGRRSRPAPARASPSPGRTCARRGPRRRRRRRRRAARPRMRSIGRRTRSSRRRPGSSRRCGPRTRRSRRRRGRRGRRSSTSRCASARRRPRGCRSTPRTATPRCGRRSRRSPRSALTSRPSASNCAAGHSSPVVGVDDGDVAPRHAACRASPAGCRATGMRITAFSLDP